MTHFPRKVGTRIQIMPMPPIIQPIPAPLVMSFIICTHLSPYFRRKPLVDSGGAFIRTIDADALASCSIGSSSVSPHS